MTMREAAALRSSSSPPGKAWWIAHRFRRAEGPGTRCGWVGHVAIQIARAFGAEVFAVDKAVKATQDRGTVREAIDRRRTTVEEYVKDHTGGRGFDIVYDTVGGARIIPAHVRPMIHWAMSSSSHRMSIADRSFVEPRACSTSP